MKRVIIYGFLLFLLALAVYGCSKEVQPPAQVPVQENITQVQVIASCDDANACTEDIFNNLTQQCEHRRLDHCCGDSVCDIDERCDEASHQTKCAQDCPRECPAYVEFTEWQCTGSCFNAGPYYVIEADAKFTTDLTNIGEKSLNDIKSQFNCIRVGGSTTFYSDRSTQPKAGVIFKDHFNSADESIYLSGEIYGRNKASYTFEVEGEPTEDVQLTCSLTMTGLEFYHSSDININLRNAA